MSTEHFTKYTCMLHTHNTFFIIHRKLVLSILFPLVMDTWAVVPIYYYNDIYMQKSNVTGIYATIFGMKYFMYATKTA